jgi:hypothetical protein
MGDAVQIGKRVPVGKDYLRQRGAVDLAVPPDNPWAKPLDDPPPKI